VAAWHRGRRCDEDSEALDALIEELADKTVSEAEMEAAFARLDAALDTTQREGRERPGAAAVTSRNWRASWRTRRKTPAHRQVPNRLENR
jgi:hypothetical protein